MLEIAMNPRWKMFVGFTCCGGALGGIGFALVIGDNPGLRGYWEWMRLGMIFGTLPAMLCALW